MLSNLRRPRCARSTRTNHIHCSRLSSVSINTHSHARVCLSTPCRGFRTLQMWYLWYWYRRARAIKSVVCARFAQGCESVGLVQNNFQLSTPAPVTPRPSRSIFDLLDAKLKASQPGIFPPNNRTRLLALPGGVFPSRQSLKAGTGCRRRRRRRYLATALSCIYLRDVSDPHVSFISIPHNAVPQQ